MGREIPLLFAYEVLLEGELTTHVCLVEYNAIAQLCLPPHTLLSIVSTGARPHSLSLRIVRSFSEGGALLRQHPPRVPDAVELFQEAMRNIDMYDDTGFGDKPPDMNRFTYWIQHIDFETIQKQADRIASMPLIEVLKAEKKSKSAEVKQ